MFILPALTGLGFEVATASISTAVRKNRNRRRTFPRVARNRKDNYLDRCSVFRHSGSFASIQSVKGRWRTCGASLGSILLLE